MKIRILATSDVHGNLLPVSYGTKSFEPCGLLALEKQMRTFEEGFTIKIDNGDILEGTPLLTHFYQNEKGVHPMARAIEACHYDYVNIGNHDLNYGTRILRDYLAHTGAQCICGNLSYKGQPFGPGYTLIETPDHKTIALIGVLTQYITHWEKKENLLDVTIEDAYEFVKKTVKDLKENIHPDGIVVVYHGGVERDLESGELTERDTGENEGYRMCMDIDGIDLIISGHQHRSFIHKINKTLMTQSTAQGREFVVIDWDLDRKDMHAEIYRNNGETDKELVAPFLSEEEEVETWLDKPIGHISGDDLTIGDSFEARLHKSPFIGFINTVQLAYTGADISGCCLFDRIGGLPHDVSLRDVLCSYPFPNSLYTLKIDGKILKAYLEKNATYFALEDGQIRPSKEFCDPKPQHYNYDMVDGVEYTIDISKPHGQRITSLTFKGQPVRDEDSFKLCINNYRAAGGGNFEMFENAEVIKEDTMGVAEMIEEYIRERKDFIFKNQDNIHVIKGDCNG